MGAAMQQDGIFDRIRQDMVQNDIVLYMKGSAVFPQCGFSAAVVQLLDNLCVPYKDVDVLSDPALRQGIKNFTNWPTITQLYIKGEFIGGADIVREMYAAGELQELLREKGLMA
jgi:monothiol glutaredoxin